MRVVVPILAIISVVSSNVIHYQIDQDVDASVSDCVDRAMERLMDETCLFFKQAEHPDESHVHFVQSGHCAWQASNKTVHLSPSCIEENTCVEMLAKMMSIDRPHHHVSRLLNIHYNCTEKCTVECGHGGRVQDDCSCSCGYGFEGAHCETLSKQPSFTDGSCGQVEAMEAGSVALSTHPDNHPKSTFCQWLIKAEDPWAVIEADLSELDMDADDVPPGQHCNDLLNVFGASDVNNPIPCDGTSFPTRIRSNSNWLLIELRTNPWASRGHSGPAIKYSLLNTAKGVPALSEEQTSSVAASLLSTVVALLAVRWL